MVSGSEKTGMSYKPTDKDLQYYKEDFINSGDKLQQQMMDDPGKVEIMFYLAKEDIMNKRQKRTLKDFKSKEEYNTYLVELYDAASRIEAEIKYGLI